MNVSPRKWRYSAHQPGFLKQLQFMSGAVDYRRGGKLRLLLFAGLKKNGSYEKI